MQEVWKNAYIENRWCRGKKGGLNLDDKIILKLCGNVFC
jgi:hypothetical protein